MKNLNGIIFYTQSKKNAESIRSLKVFKKTNKFWSGKFNSRDKIGSLMFLIRKCKPRDIRKWYDFYLSSGEKFDQLVSKKEKVIPKKFGRSAEYLANLANDFRAYLKENDIVISFDEALKFVSVRVLYETYLGYKREENTINNISSILRKKGLRLSDTAKGIEISNEDLDYKFAVDKLIVDKDGNCIAAIQIKSKLWAEGIKNVDTDVNIKKHKMFKEKTGIDVAFICTDKGEVDAKEIEKIVG